MKSSAGNPKKKKKTRNINHLPKRKPDRVPKKNGLVRVPESSGSKPSSSSSKSTSCNKRSFSCWADSTSGQAAWDWGGWGWWFSRTVFWLGKPLMIEWLGCWVVSRSEILMELVYFSPVIYVQVINDYVLIYVYISMYAWLRYCPVFSVFT